jgi:hypothetical protein
MGRGGSLSLFRGFRLSAEGRVRAEIRDVSLPRLVPIVVAVMKRRSESADRADCQETHQNASCHLYVLSRDPEPTSAMAMPVAVAPAPAGN